MHDACHCGTHYSFRSKCLPQLLETLLCPPSPLASVSWFLPVSEKWFSFLFSCPYNQIHWAPNFSGCAVGAALRLPGLSTSPGASLSVTRGCQECKLPTAVPLSTHHLHHNMFWEGSHFGRNCPQQADLFQKSPGNNAGWRLWLCKDNTDWLRMSESKALGERVLPSISTEAQWEHLPHYTTDWSRCCEHQPITCLDIWKDIGMTPIGPWEKQKGTRSSVSISSRYLTRAHINHVSLIQ